MDKTLLPELIERNQKVISTMEKLEMTYKKYCRLEAERDGKIEVAEEKEDRHLKTYYINHYRDELSETWASFLTLELYLSRDLSALLEQLVIDLKDVTDKFNLIHDIVSTYEFEWMLDNNFAEKGWLDLRNNLNKALEIVSSDNADYAFSAAASMQKGHRKNTLARAYKKFNVED